VTTQPKRECRNCGDQFIPVHRLMGPVEGFRVPEDYEYGESRVLYCSRWCREANRRIRDRERKAHVGVGEKRFKGDGETWDERREPPVGKCRQCGLRRALRFDTYGDVTDSHIEIAGEFCSGNCAAKWWKLQPEPPGPLDACVEIRRLIGTWNPRKEKKKRDRKHSEKLDLSFLDVPAEGL
jgi:hypothetical protein